MFKRSSSPAKLTKPEQGDSAKLSLVTAALELFGTKGFDATSTRDIAAAARANIASIAYHFTGKEGLRTACAAFVAGKVGAVLNEAMPDPQKIESMSESEAEQSIVDIAHAMVRFFVTDPTSEAVARFAVREQMFSTPAFEHLYTGLFEPMHKRLCLLWARATGEPATAPQTLLRAFTVVGQIVFFRLARHAVFRRMEWQERDADQHLSEIFAMIESNIRTLIVEARRHA